MSLVQRITDLATAVGQDIKGLIEGMGLLASLTTTSKSSLVDAINEVNAKPAGDVIDDAVVASLKAWSSEKVAQMLRGVGGGLVYTSGLNFNNMTQIGFFWLGSVAGQPKATTWGWAVLNACDNETNHSGFQIAIDIQTGGTFRRWKFGAAGWSAWGEITMDLPKITVSTTAPPDPVVGQLWVDMN